jgi:hypothetical protein
MSCANLRAVFKRLIRYMRATCDRLASPTSASPDTAYEPLARHYDSKEVANITYAIALMNAWRIGRPQSISDAGRADRSQGAW